VPTGTPTIYHREKDAGGKWLNPKKIVEGRGHSTSDLKPPFSIRPVINARQSWHRLVAQTFAEAKAEAQKFYIKLQAHEHGAVIPEIDDTNRITLRAAVDDYIEHKEKEVFRRRATIKQYKTALSEFVEGSGVRYVDEITETVLRRYLKFLNHPRHDAEGRLIRPGYSPKTISVRMTVIFSLLKKHKIQARVDLPTVPKKAAQPFSPAEIKKLFDAMDDEEKFRYGFFLDTACREQEVMYATWNDIDWANKEPKSHEERHVPLSDTMIEQLKAHHNNPAHLRWIFINGDNNPESHFLDKFKRIALRAGVNCGHCTKSRKERRYEKKTVQVSCKTHPVCEKIYLHRLRKTKATRWHEAGVPVRTIQAWLGHSSLEVTQIYLGETDSSKLRDEINAAQRKAYGD
jgi:integrase